MFFNHLFSPFLVKELFLLCLGWRILFIFLFNITFCKKLAMAPLCVIGFMGHIRYLFVNFNMVYGTTTFLVHLRLLWCL